MDVMHVSFKFEYPPTKSTPLAVVHKNLEHADHDIHDSSHLAVTWINPQLISLITLSLVDHGKQSEILPLTCGWAD